MRKVFNNKLFYKSLILGRTKTFAHLPLIWITQLFETTEHALLKPIQLINRPRQNRPNRFSKYPLRRCCFQGQASL
jgi:hypothetical protein